jgi:hypothetical protein
MLLRALALTLTLAAVACGSRPSISTEGLGQPCPPGGCQKGQTCIVGGPENFASCEISCQENADCPDGYDCRLPPVPPDALAYVCFER